MQGIATFLWFDGTAHEAAHFYVSLFSDASITDESASSASFRLMGQDFIAFDGGPAYQFSRAASVFVKCESQVEIDRLWTALTENGGEPVRCGWLQDRFGLSWQIVPVRLLDLLADEDGERADRVMQAMLGMTKLDIAALERA